MNNHFKPSKTKLTLLSKTAGVCSVSPSNSSFTDHFTAIEEIHCYHHGALLPVHQVRHEDAAAEITQTKLTNTNLYENTRRTQLKAIKEDETREVKLNTAHTGSDR